MFDCEYVETKAGSNRFKRHIQEKAPLKKKVGRPKKIESEVRNVAIPVTLNQCNAKRNEIVTKHRNGEEPPSTANRKKRVILLIDTVANNYFNVIFISICSEGVITLEYWEENRKISRTL